MNLTDEQMMHLEAGLNKIAEKDDTACMVEQSATYVWIHMTDEKEDKETIKGYYLGDVEGQPIFRWTNLNDETLALTDLSPAAISRASEF